MTGIMTAMLGIGGAAGNFTVTVGTAGSSNGATAQTFWGWSTIGFLDGQPNSTYYPDYLLLTMGSVSSPAPTIGGFNVLGAYSIGINSSSIATYYAVIVEGNVSGTPGLISNMSVDGTAIVYSTKTVNFVAQSRIGTGSFLSTTYFLFTLTSTAATLFGTTAGATKTVSIS
jgi:hypothetical protein